MKRLALKRHPPQSWSRQVAACTKAKARQQALGPNAGYDANVSPARCLILLSLLLASCGLVPEPPAGLECQRTAAAGGELREGEDPLAPGGPLAEVPVTEVTADAVGERAQQAGFEVTYRYEYDVGPQPESGSTGYAECWCVPPPPGQVYVVAYDSIGRIIVMVDSGEHRDAVRPQPELGWGCEGDPSSS